MKLLGIDTESMRILGRFTFTNTTEFPIVVSLWQTGPLYYRVIEPNGTWSTDCGAVWFTVKVWLFNGENNINPGIKYSILAGNIVGFAALGALGLGATALVTQYGTFVRNPDWEEWLNYNSLHALDDKEVIKGISAIGKCQLSQAGFYAGKHPHLYVSGGPVKRVSEKGGNLSLEWHEFRVDKCSFENAAMPIIPAEQAVDEIFDRYTDNDSDERPVLPARRQIEQRSHQIDLIDNESHGSLPPPKPSRVQKSQTLDEAEKPAMPKRPTKPSAPSTLSEDEFRYQINP